MMPPAFDHIFLRASGQPVPYTTPTRRGPQRNIPQRNRQEHAEWLQQRLIRARRTDQENMQARRAVALPVRDGLYLEFESAPDCVLTLKSLEDRRAHIRLVNVRTLTDAKDGAQEVVRATVYIPKSRESHFLQKVQQYAEENTSTNKPKNQPLIESIEDIRLAVVDAFWVGPHELMPENEPVWCEIWLRDETPETETSFRTVARRLDILLQEPVLRFPERLVLLGLVNREHLAQLVESSDSLAEFRRAKETARFFLELENREQTAWVENLRARLSVVDDPQAVITVLDTGVNNGHVLLQPVLADEDCHAVDPTWGVTDHHGHGTLMSGVAAYGDLQACLEATSPVQLQHVLESVKILPPYGTNDPQLYGYITNQALSRAEIAAPDRLRIACLAVTAKDGVDGGRPSSWSAAIDQLTSGYDDDIRRLFVVAAGNVDAGAWSTYPQGNLDASIHDPGQSWNALTVGAYTEKARVTNPDLVDHVPVAAPGGLSPFSSTSRTWDAKRWPSKPDIVLEGGNLLQGPDDFITEEDDIRLLSTGHQPTRRQLEYHSMTSAATAQAAWMAAQIQAAYPQAWPETVRGLLVHSARWTDEMKRQFLSSGNKTDYANLLRVCGYGVPDLDRAVNCYRNSLTLIAQEELQPFEVSPEHGRRSQRTKEMHLHKLPWPRDILLSLGEVEVTLRITLSYFVEPSPGEVGWENRYRYASHALRFDLNRFSEDQTAFLHRINAASRDEENDLPSSSDTHSWTIGANGRKLGSIHSDIWTGTAADLATCNMIGVYPVIGWWRERHWLGRVERRARYSLIVSIDTPEIDVDIYTPVATTLRIPITI